MSVNSAGKGTRAGRAAVVVIGVVALVGAWRALAGVATHNAAMLLVRAALITASESGPLHYPHVAEIRPNEPAVVSAVRLLRLAADLAPGSSAIRWALGRALLMSGSFEEAARALEEVSPGSPASPRFADLLVAFSYGGRAALARAQIEQAGERLDSAELTEAASFAYLEGARDGSLTRTAAAARILAFRPEDLWAAAVMLEEAQRHGPHGEAEEWQRRLATVASLPTGKWLFDATKPEVIRSASYWTPEKRQHIAALLAWDHPDSPRAGALLAQLARAEPGEPLWPAYSAVHSRRIGDIEGAAAAIAEAERRGRIARDTALARGELAETRLALLGDSRRTQSLEDAAKAYATAATASRDDSLVLARLAAVCAQLSRAEPGTSDCPDDWLRSWRTALDSLRRVAVRPLSVAGGRILRGYLADEAALTRGEPVDLLLFWDIPAGQVPGGPEAGWWPTHEGWVQVRRGVRSLVSNGGFELGTVLGRPSGFPGELYSNPAETKQVVQATRDGTTGAGLLQNSQKDTLSSFVSRREPAVPGTIYLQGGWLKSARGNGYLGRAFMRGLNDVHYRADDSYVVRDFRDPAWVHVAGAVVAPAWAETIEVRVLNYFATGKLLVDGLWLVPLPPPDALSPGTL